MEALPRVDRAIDQSEEQPDVALLRDCGRLAARWGGYDYTHGLTDGVQITRSVSELHEQSDSSIAFNAYRVRPSPDDDHRFRINKFFTRYVIAVEVSREIDVLPPHIRKAVVEIFGEEMVEDADILTEIHRVFCTVNSQDGYFHQSIQVDYAMDDHEIDLTDIDDGEDYDEDFEDEGDLLDSGASQFPDEGEFWDDDADLSSEARLLNDAWALFAEAGNHLHTDNSPFDLEMLKSMVRIDRRLEIQESKMTRLCTIAMLEIRNLQMQNCRNILKKFNSNECM